MASLWEKLKTLVGGVSHDVIDAKIDDHPIAYLKQVIRKAEDARKQLENGLARARAEISVTRRDVEHKRNQIVETEAEAKQFIGDQDPTNDHWADDAMARVGDFEHELATLQADLGNQEEAVVSLQQVLQQVDAKVQAAIRQIRRLETLDRSAKATEQAAGALEQAGSVAQMDTSRTVDDASRRLEIRAETAKEQLKMRQAQFGGGGAQEAMRQSKAAERVAALRAEIEAEKAAKNGGAPAGAPATTARPTP